VTIKAMRVDSTVAAELSAILGDRIATNDTERDARGRAKTADHAATVMTSSSGAAIAAAV